MATIKVLSPVGEPRAAHRAVPAMPAELRGLTVGFLDNTKANFDLLASEIGEILRERLGIRGVVHRRKANASTPAAPEVIEALAKECDVVFAGSAD